MVLLAKQLLLGRAFTQAVGFVVALGIASVFGPMGSLALAQDASGSMPKIESLEENPGDESAANRTGAAQTVADGQAGDADESLRYSMAPMNGGMVRLDRESGTMDFCTTHSGKLVCRLATEEREGYENEIVRLQSRLRELEAERPGEPDAGLEEDRRLDEAMRHAGKALRRFFDAVKDLRTDLEKDGETR